MHEEKGEKRLIELKRIKNKVMVGMLTNDVRIAIASIAYGR